MSGEKNYALYSHVKEKEIGWLWYPYIPLGKITLLQGDPGDGKSTFILNIIACLTTGRALPDGSETSVCNVIYQCSEDGQNDTTKPRLIASGADCSRVAFIDENNSDTELSIIDERIEKAIKDFDARLFVLDPLQSYLPQDGDMQSASRMRHMMKKLAGVADKYNCAVVLIGHMTKSSVGKKQLYRGLGSIDIAAIARSILMITRDEEDPSLRYMSQVKNNLSYEGSTIGFLFDKNRGFQWIGKCQIANEVIEICNSSERKGETVRKVLNAMLSAGDMESNKVYEKFEELGIGNRTVRKVQKQMGVQAIKKGTVWYWHLDKRETEN